MDIATVKEYLGAEWVAVQNRIAGSLESDIELLNQTNRSILSHSGKQLRPILALLTARGCSADGRSSEATVRYAAAAELMHNATLLHDDVADDSDPYERMKREATQEQTDRILRMLRINNDNDEENGK